jgi:hypothetical protein
MLTLLVAFCFVLIDDPPRRVEPTVVGRNLEGRRIIVEGVYAASGRIDSNGMTPMQLRRCNATFLVPKRLVPTGGFEGNLEVTGTVELNGQRAQVIVDKLERLPTDDDHYREAAGKAKDDADAWFALSEWADQRAKLYDNRELANKSAEAYRRGIGSLREKAAGDPAALAAIKARVHKERRWPDFDFEDVDHEILRAEEAKVPAGDRAKLAEFIEAVARRLPGAREVMKPIDPRLAAAYDRDPVKAYGSVEGEHRLAMARYGYSKLVRKLLALEGEAGETGPYEIAKRAKEKLPEYPDEARKWIGKWADAQLAKLAELDADTLDKLAKTMAEEMGKPSEANDIRGEWLDRQERIWRDDENRKRNLALERNAVFRPDFRGLFDIAKQRQTWFPRDEKMREKSVKIYQEILAEVKDYPPAIAELKALGYQHDPKLGWVAQSSPSGPARRATERRPITTEMSDKEVLAQLGAPSGKCRIGGAQGTTHAWTYESPAETLVVILTGAPNALRVVKVHRTAVK